MREGAVVSGERRVRLQEVARAAGVSVSAVSYALRGAANIPEETAARVRAAAEQLGYRPNARVGELMAHIRRAKPLASAEPLAFVYLEGARSGAKAGGFSRKVENAARVHAAERGYRLDTFRLADVKGSARRLAGILRARGIGGVLFAPMVSGEPVAVEWPWEEFAVAVVGMSELGRAVPRAAHHHYEAMRETWARLAAAGARRPVAMIDAATNERAHRGWEAAWRAFGPRDAGRRLWLQAEQREAERAAWWERMKPDAVVADQAEFLRWAVERAPGMAAERCAVLSWEPGGEFRGIDQGYDAIAAHAVDLLVTQLQRNERGVPEPPSMLLFPGRWREAGGGSPNVK